MSFFFFFLSLRQRNISINDTMKNKMFKKIKKKKKQKWSVDKVNSIRKKKNKQFGWRLEHYLYGFPNRRNYFKEFDFYLLGKVFINISTVFIHIYQTWETFLEKQATWDMVYHQVEARY